MLNSILLLGSCYNKYKRISLLFTILLLLNVFIVQFGHVKIDFFIYNMFVMLSISLFNKKIKNNSVKIISSAFSIIVWSVLIDISCYYMFPMFNSNLNLLSYIFSGIIFNLKYVAYNVLIIMSLNAFAFVIKYIKNRVKIKQMIYIKE